MNKFIKSIILLCLSVQILVAQSKFGIEIKGSIHQTENSGKVEGSLLFSHIKNERRAINYSSSVGVSYEIKESHIVKLHFGWHQNGIMFDLRFIDDQSGVKPYYEINKPLNYYQLSPSYVYRIWNTKLIIPLEIGLNINKRTKDSDLLLPIRNINFDLRLGLGIHYHLSKQLIAGVNGIYVSNISNYEESYVIGTYRPKQIGLELSIQYEL